MEVETVLKDYIDTESIKKWKDKYNREITENKQASAQTKFEYGWVLLRSPDLNDVAAGIKIFEELFPDGNTELQREYLYYLSVGSFRIKNHEKALVYIRALLKVEPNNRQALDLEKYIIQKTTESQKEKNNDRLLGLALVGGAAVAAVGTLIGLGVSLARHK